MPNGRLTIPPLVLQHRYSLSTVAPAFVVFISPFFEDLVLLSYLDFFFIVLSTPVLACSPPACSHLLYPCVLFSWGSFPPSSPSQHAWIEVIQAPKWLWMSRLSPSDLWSDEVPPIWGTLPQAHYQAFSIRPDPTAPTPSLLLIQLGGKTEWTLYTLITCSPPSTCRNHVWQDRLLVSTWLWPNALLGCTRSHSVLLAPCAPHSHL